LAGEYQSLIAYLMDRIMRDEKNGKVGLFNQSKYL
jgi:hypothetical protein